MKSKLFHFLDSPNRPGLYALLAALSLTLASAAFFLITNEIFDAKLSFLFFTIAVGLFLLEQSNPNLTRLTAITRGALLFMILYGVSILFQISHRNIIHPREWDFMCWFVDGKLAVSGLNFYDLDNYKAVFDEAVVPLIPLTPSQDFLDETVNLGFLYFPQAILLYYPLGFFDFDTAHILWACLNYLFLFGSIIVARQVFFQKAKPGLGLMYSAVFLLLYPSTKLVFSYDQNHFILIFFLLLALKTISKYRTGIWLALGVCIKPIGLIFGLILLAKAKWKALFAGAVTGLVISSLTVALLGFSTVMSFFTENPHVNVPEFMYTQNTNVSILGVILRKIDFDFASGTPTRQPLYLAITLLLTLITLYFVYKLPKKYSNWGLALIIALSIVIYPGTLTPYSAFLVIPFLYLMTSENKEILNNTTKYILLIVFSGLLLAAVWTVFFANVLMWGLLLFSAYKLSNAATQSKGEIAKNLETINY